MIRQTPEAVADETLVAIAASEALLHRILRRHP